MLYLCMGAVFALGFIGAILAALALFVVFTAVSAFLVSAVLLGSGIVLKCVNIKLGWRNFGVYSTVLLVIGGVYTAANIIYVIFAFSAINIFQ